MPDLELFGTAMCPFTRDAREALEWKRQTFVEHDVEADGEALARLITLTGQRAVPVLVEDGRVVQIGWEGRCCFLGSAVRTEVS
jgi:glutaredoxin 3